MWPLVFLYLLPFDKVDTRSFGVNVAFNGNRSFLQDLDFESNDLVLTPLMFTEINILSKFG